MQNTVVWFDIPVIDIERAKTFYQKILDVEFQDIENNGMKYAMFPFAPGVASGALVESPDHAPTLTGTLIYLNGGDDLDTPLRKVEASGGEILSPKTSIGEYGFIAYFKDTEGNKIALHSPG